MTTSILRFEGPSQQGRAQLVRLLKAFPNVQFRERAPAEYQVIASDEAAIRALAIQPGWSLTQTH